MNPRNILYPILSLVVFAAMVLNSCKKECPCTDPSNPQCENYDPCYGKKTINTFFKVRPGDRGFPPPEEWCELIPCDTFNESSVRFDIPHGNPENSTYEWQIGTEPTPRTGKTFEVNFSDYLRDKGWERHIPITLTIRTPINSCLTNPKDTLVSITRELFFTPKPILLLENGETSVKYKGYFAHEPNKEVVMEYIQLQTGEFRGLKAPIFLTVGIPNIDTFVVPKNCPAQFCYNYKHQRWRVVDVNLCSPNISNYYYASEWIFSNNRHHIIERLELHPPNRKLIYEFHGTKI
jgi:hypothetical protein